MGEAKRRKALGYVPPRRPETADHQSDRDRVSSVAASGSSSTGTDQFPLTFDQARELTAREGATCWTWVSRRSKGRVVGADTYITYRDEDSEDGESTDEAWVRMEGDDWTDPTIGEEDDSSMDDLDGEARESVWYRTTKDRFDLPDISFLKLRDLGCADPAVLARARAFDAEG
jgi:hypothetical protein